MQYTEKELQKLIENVEKEFTAHLAKAEEGFKATLAKSESAESAAPSVDGTEPLAKAEDDKPAKAEDEKKEDKEEAPKSDEKPAAEAKEGEKPAEAPAKEEGKEEAPAAPEAKEAPAANADGCDYDDEDMDHMHKMYASMSKGELKAHHDAIKKTLDGMCGGEMAPAPAAAAPMAKSEETAVAVEVKPEVIQPAQDVELLKSEVEAKTAKIAELQKNLELVTEFVTKLAKKSAPQGKAITHLETIAKTEVKEEKELSKSEITTILAKKAADPSLSKSDRDAINAYYLTGASINKINHLLK
jgi:hypothetical protein